MEFKHYTYVGHGDIPVTDDYYETPDYDALVRGVGEDPNNENISTTLLSEDWNGHPKGALVVTSLWVRDYPFYVSTERVPDADRYGV